jgi:hypothetical protein
MIAILYDDNCAALHCVGCDQNHWAGKISACSKERTAVRSILRSKALVW